MKRSLIVQHDRNGNNSANFKDLVKISPFKVQTSGKEGNAKAEYSEGHDISPLSNVNFSLFFNKFMFSPPGKQTFSIQPNKQLDTSYLKHLEFIETQSDCYVTLKLIGPLALGLGNSHPSENGINFHHLWNVPVISGSSLKGAIRAWAEETDKCTTTITRFFGPGNHNNPDDDKEKGTDSQGKVIFFDALPVLSESKGITVFVDTIAPHYSGYYKPCNNRIYPTDWQQPVPINFIAIAPECQFQFAFKFRDNNNKGDITTLSEWLKEALEENGLGAKTAQGYGCFRTI